jgi:hypothetical protein
MSPAARPLKIVSAPVGAMSFRSPCGANATFQKGSSKR